MSKSKTELGKSLVDFVLDGVDLHTRGSQPVEDSLVSEPDEPLFKINGHTSLSSDPISDFLKDGFFGGVQGNGGNVIFVSLPDVLIVDFSFSSEI